MKNLTIEEIEKIPSAFLTAEQVAQALGISRSTLYSNADNFDFPIHRVGAQYRIPKEPFITFLRTGSYKGKPNEDKVVTVCYGKTEKWESRKDAELYFLEAMRNANGAERDRYTNILLAIISGSNYCTDEEN